MSNTITFEREKLNQAMYQKLKKFIMNKRKREAEERAQADYYKRLKKEREERKRQIKFSTESLENAKREIFETKKRISLLKTEKDALFTRFKQITQECKLREVEIRARNQQIQMEKVALYADQCQGRASQDALLMLPKTAHKGFGGSCSLDVISQTSALRKQVGQLYCPSQFSPSSSTHGVHDSSAANPNLGSVAFSGLDKRQMAIYGSLIPQQQQFLAKSFPDGPVNNILGNREMTAQELQAISKYLVELGAASGKLQSEVLSAINAGTLSAFLNNPKLAAMVAASSLGSNPRSPSTSGLPTPTGVSSSAAAGPPLSSGSGTFLPPAPTGYRGSITTGQSAQQIQMAQQLAAQQQAAALYAGRGASQPQPQQPQ
ncbi:serine-rich repeat protein 2 [Echinococcus granulosus]|uniref:Serine-rich repeat protein 2 n=1 Tax=Echinococcus granulosus TaxID=6210 RepID=W6UP68_ECHGR|nr:serine-rich repeat protein 2 [Echinococcus granulosus]EUB63033.1 serine-rich repeat protein 2 [Echinococcus granulosus]